jgi:putative redox protein
MTSSGETTLRLQDGLRFVATTPSGFDVTLDSRVESPDEAAGPSPMEVQLVALGGCTGMDTISILRKMREDVTGYSVGLTQRRAADHPKVFTSIQIEHRFRGNGLREANVRRAIALTMTRYCPVFAMLFPKVAITERFEIIDDGSGVVIAGDASAEDALASEPT